MIRPRRRSRQCRNGDFVVSDTVIDVPEVQAFAFLVPPHLADDAGPFQLAKDEITLRVGVGIGRVGDLEGQFRQRDPCVPCAGAYPHDRRVEQRPIDVEPEFNFVERVSRPLQAQRPEADVVALARAHVDRFLEADILLAAEQVERTEMRLKRSEPWLATALQAMTIGHEEQLGQIVIPLTI